MQKMQKNNMKIWNDVEINKRAAPTTYGKIILWILDSPLKSTNFSAQKEKKEKNNKAEIYNKKV